MNETPASVLAVETNMKDYNTAEDRSNGIPERFIPDEPAVIGDEYSLSPEDWNCEALIYVCHRCARLSRGFEEHVVHSAESHRETNEHPVSSCSALAADGFYWPEGGPEVVNQAQEQFSDGESTPNRLADIVG